MSHEGPTPTPGISVHPVLGIPDVRPGDDLAKLIVDAAPWLRDLDILVVTSKIVSKTEGALAAVPESGPEREAAREQVLRSQTARTVATRGHTRIVQTHHGFVLASAGIDASNVRRDRLVLLPADPDRSARDLRTTLLDRYGLDVAVVVSDTMGRPWRNGLTDVALGCAGIGPLRDHRGEVDPYGNDLHITQMAVVDELSAAAELVKGKIDQVPVAVVRGLLDRTVDGPPVVPTLVREAAQDLFAMGTAEARQAGRLDLIRWQFDLAARFLDSVLDGLSDDECRWEPAQPCWTVRADATGVWHADWEQPEPEPVPNTSIGWLTWHIGWWWTAAQAGLTGADIPAPASIHWLGSAAATVAWLRELSASWRRLLDDSGLELSATARFPWRDDPDRTVAHTLAWVDMELMKNAAQICQLRRMYRP